MGGVSESSFQIDPSGGENGGPIGIFKGLCQILASACYITIYLFIYFLGEALYYGITSCIRVFKLT